MFQQMLDNVGINLPNYKLRSLTEDLTSSRGDHSNGLTKPEFERLCQKLTQEDVRRTFKTSKQHDRQTCTRCLMHNLQYSETQIGGLSKAKKQRTLKQSVGKDLC